MKTKTIFMLCLLSGIAITNLSAQPVVAGTKSVRVVTEWSGYWQPVYCNGEWIDVLTGTVTVYVIQHYVDGVLTWSNYHNNGEATSQNTGEIFTVREKDHQEIIGQGIVTWHFNLVGDHGNHYVGTMTWDYFNDIITVDKAICLENGKK